MPFGLRICAFILFTSHVCVSFQVHELSVTLITSSKISSLSFAILREVNVTMYYSILRSKRRMDLSKNFLGIITSALKVCISDAVP